MPDGRGLTPEVRRRFSAMLPGMVAKPRVAIVGAGNLGQRLLSRLSERDT